MMKIHEKLLALFEFLNFKINGQQLLKSTWKASLAGFRGRWKRISYHTSKFQTGGFKMSEFEFFSL